MENCSLFRKMGTLELKTKVTRNHLQKSSPGEDSRAAQTGQQEAPGPACSPGEDSRAAQTGQQEAPGPACSPGEDSRTAQTGQQEAPGVQPGRGLASCTDRTAGGARRAAQRESRKARKSVLRSEGGGAPWGADLQLERRGPSCLSWPAPLPPGTRMLRPALQTWVRSQHFLESEQTEPVILSIGCKL